MSMKDLKNDRLLVPEMLREYNQWTYSFSTSELKRPTHTDYKLNGGLSFPDALLGAGLDRYIGFFPTKDDPIGLIDLDNIKNPNDPWDELPPKLSLFLKELDTYSEISPSGKGLRFVVQLKDKNEKSLTSGKNFYSNELEDRKKAKKVQLNLGPPWQTITQDVTEFSSNAVATVSLDSLGQVFRLKYKVKDLKSGTPLTSLSDAPTNMPMLNEVKGKFLDIPLDQNDRIVRGYEKMTGNSYQHYAFWTHMLMSLHHYATITDQVVECFSIADEWSKNDVENYKGPEDIRKHWESFETNKDTSITYRSIFGVYNACNILWPQTYPQTEEERLYGRPKRPKQKYYANFETLMDFYNIKLIRDKDDEHVLYLSGDNDIVHTYFKRPGAKWHFRNFFGPLKSEEMFHSLFIMLQEEGFGDITYALTKDHLAVWRSTQHKRLNIVKMYFETPFSQLAEEFQGNACNVGTSTYESLWRCITLEYLTDDLVFEEYCLYRSMLKKWLFGFIRGVYPVAKNASNNSLLVLTGREQIRKTSFFRYLFPAAIRGLSFTTHGFSSETDLRDVVKIASSNRIVVWDEIERYLTHKTESSFKKVIDGLPQTFIDKYQVATTTYAPIAIYGGTSNKRRFQLSKTGNRRLFHIPVQWIDTDAMDRLCWHPILVDLKEEYMDRLEIYGTPELLAPDELELQDILVTEISTQSNLEIMLNEVYNFKEPFEFLGQVIPGVSTFRNDSSHRLLSIGQVHTDLVSKFPHRVVDFAELHEIMTNLCAEWSNTKRRARHYRSPKFTINRGIAKQNQYRKFFVPLRKVGIRQEVRDQFT